jgi:hypothetical protein
MALEMLPILESNKKLQVQSTYNAKNILRNGLIAKMGSGP